MTSPRTPRQLLGWTVPDHVLHNSYLIGGDDVEVLACTYGPGSTTKVTIQNPTEGDERVGRYLREHAHGETVERLSEVLPETPEPPREDGPRSDAPTLWRRLQVAARVIKAFKPEDPSPELVAFLRDIRDAVDGDLLEDELSGDLIRFARGQGRLLTALLAAQGTEVAEDATDDHSAERAAHADNWEAQP